MASTINVDAVAEKLQNLHAFYHKQWWCRLQMFNYFKRCHATFNVVTLFILALSMVVDSVWKESFAMMGWTAAATFVKGWSDFKKYSLKMDMSRFAYTTYEKTLFEINTAILSGEFDLNSFLVKMQTLDDIVTDFAPPILERFTRLYCNKRLIP